MSDINYAHRKFWGKVDTSQPPSQIHPEIAEAAEAVRKNSINGGTNIDLPLGVLPDCHSPLSSSCLSHESERDHEQHVPHMIYQTQGHRLSIHERNRRTSLSATIHPGLLPLAGASQLFNPYLLPKQRAIAPLPDYIKPLPARITTDDIEYLEKKGALSIPGLVLRNELLRAYVEYVHGYMPLLELREFLDALDSNDGSAKRISLLLFQAVMFAGTAFVDMKHLRRAGYSTRKEARKTFFLKARLLYDFDYEVDRIALVQAILLMTYWYETPDDQKDTWHWMGVAISLSHTIGLHRNPEKSNMDLKRQRLWKRIWWSCFMRDRLIALGMRRPTRIKNEDYDVPILTIDDFELGPLPEDATCLPRDCLLAWDTDKQRQTAIMCIEKAKLCLCISHVLSTQYSVLNNNLGGVTAEGNPATTMMLLPKKLDAETCEVELCDLELKKWVDELPEDLKYPEVSTTELGNGEEVFVVHRALLNMIYHTTLSALHRPQVLPSAWPARSSGTELHELSRKKVRHAAAEITRTAQDLQQHNLVRYLPTTGVTVLLPAVIIHLLDIKSSNEETRRASLQGFCHCMQVMQKLRESYASADYATQFLEAAVRKVDIQVSLNMPLDKQRRLPNLAGLVDAGRRTTLTPPPEDYKITQSNDADTDVAVKFESSMASTPPASEESEHVVDPYLDLAAKDSIKASLASMIQSTSNDLMASSSNDYDLDSFLNLEDAGDALTFDDEEDTGMPTSLHGESSGFTLDIDWMKDMKDFHGTGVNQIDFIDGDRPVEEMVQA
ncbi:MAG: hypothetical protein M1830_005550 [Pleopsidium flavum]|nr:MAG: hypothetical protein M1830_005550 [Pleopsidium flavum]